MECPHCTKGIAPTFYATSIAPHIPEKNCTVFSAMCPWCKERILYNKFTEGSAFGVRNQMATEDFEKLLGLPK
jgi:hypothetical protein